ncbi:MAG: DUF6398 domain-containing protein [Pseudomonadota bacterium]
MKPEQIPEGMKHIFDTVITLVDQCCANALNDEYRKVCHKAVAKLCRKRPSPLSRGNINAWVCGIIYAIGQVNFLFDRNNEPYLSASDLCSMFGISKSTGSARAREVSKMLKSYPLDPKWSLPSVLKRNPLTWMIEVNGFIVDARTLPHPMQQIAYEKGLIPYIPVKEGEHEH